MFTNKALPAVFAALSATCAIWAGAAQARCDIDLYLFNRAGVNVAVSIPSAELRSRVQGVAWGPWRRATQGGWFDGNATAWIGVPAQEYRRDIYRATNFCWDRRQLRLTYRCQGGPHNGSSFQFQQEIEISPYQYEIDRVIVHIGDRCR